MVSSLGRDAPAEATIEAACWAHGQSELGAGALVHISRCPNFVRRRTTSGGETVHRNVDGRSLDSD